jgi:hypothetical protein
MQLIDFARLNYQRLNATIADMGMADFNNLPFPVILKKLDLGSERDTKEYFPIQQPSGKIDLSGSIQILKQQRKIVEAIGSTKISTNTPICFSTFVGIKPKEYLKQYVEVAKILCGPLSELRFIVWLEDTLTILKNDWNISTAQQAVNTYKAFFSKEFPECQILLSSEIAPIGIPQGFAERLSAITTEEFLSVLPFHLRNPSFVRIFDLVHFAWNCYVVYRLPGVYLAGINNKHHFQLFRKIVGKQISVLLLPLGPEDFII